MTEDSGSREELIAEDSGSVCFWKLQEPVNLQSERAKLN